jgi:hypothetical protein
MALLRENTEYAAEAARLFSPHTGGRPGEPGHPYEPELDVFGPLFRFLLRPTPALKAEVDKFSRKHFFRPVEESSINMVSSNHLVLSKRDTGVPSGAPLIVGVHARVQDITGNLRKDPTRRARSCAAPGFQATRRYPVSSETSVSCVCHRTTCRSRHKHTNQLHGCASMR